MVALHYSDNTVTPGGFPTERPSMAYIEFVLHSLVCESLYTALAIEKFIVSLCGALLNEVSPVLGGKSQLMNHSEFDTVDLTSLFDRCERERICVW